MARPSHVQVQVANPSTPLPLPARVSTRQRVSKSVSAPSTPLPLTPTDPIPSTSKLPPPSRQPVEAKTHALRSVLGGNERAPCPFPAEFGGKKKCGVDDEEENDEVLMGICAACAINDNRALTPEHIADICISNGWIRQPSRAVIPGTLVTNSIRSHQRKCQIATPPRIPLLVKYQLSGSSNECALEPALHPEALQDGTRPKGAVWARGAKDPDPTTDSAEKDEKARGGGAQPEGKGKARGAGQADPIGAEWWTRGGRDFGYRVVEVDLAVEVEGGGQYAIEWTDYFAPENRVEEDERVVGIGLGLGYN
ncbi:hypothetical protein P7C73_g6882, partial [Tremellales sp. Uapishka_1]